MSKKKIQRKERVKWRRITIGISDELYELLEQRAGLAGVSLSRFAFTVLKRKKVVIVPGFSEFVWQIKQICKELNVTQSDPQVVRELVVSLNRNIELFEEATTEVLYPRLIETNSAKYEVAMPPKQFFRNLVEV